MTTHTPGPWTTSPKNGRVVTSGETKIATAANTGNPPIAWNNARLIAAAPALLEALREIAELPGVRSDEACTIARAAIAKATGKE